MTATLSSFPIGTKLRGSQLGTVLSAVSAITNIEGLWIAAMSAGSTTSASYTNLPGSASFSFTKQEASSRLLVYMNWSARVGTAVKQTEGAVQIGVTDYQITHQEIPAIAQHWEMSNIRIITGVAAGATTIQGRYRSNDGVTTVTIDSNDVLSMLCLEIPA